MRDGKKAVSTLDAILEQCRMAYQSKMPFIMLDTEEYGLALQVVMRLVESESGLMTLLREAEWEKFSKPYYKFLEDGPDPLSKCKNFYTTPTALITGSAESRDLDAQKFPGLFLLHLAQGSWKKTGGESYSLVSILRLYAKRYEECLDNQAPLRCSCVLLYGDPALLPDDLKPLTEIVEVGYPGKQEIMGIIAEMAEKNRTPVELQEQLQQFATELSGLSRMEVRRRMQRLLWTDYIDGRPILFENEVRTEVIQAAKRQFLLRNGGLLTLPKDKKDDPAKKRGASSQNALGGLDAYKKWVEENRDRMQNAENYALERGVPALKGVLLCGVPGCGKSEAAKILRREWNLPLVQFNIDQLMGGYVGDSERNMREALKQAEAMSPCILWVDELEKGFSCASGSGSSDSGTFKRMFGRFLTWMQEKTHPCFIFATANDISQLPDEFFRSGRFDALFSVFMPTRDECVEIFREQMRRAERLRSDTAKERGDAPRTWPLFEGGEQGCDTADTLNKIMSCFTEGVDIENPEGVKFVSGADIQKIVVTALTRLEKSALGKPITAAEWKKAVHAVIRDPTINTQGGSPAGMDAIAACYLRLLRGNFVPASKQCLLEKSRYWVKWDVKKQRLDAGYKAPASLPEDWSDYDRALHNAVLDHLNRMATNLERQELLKTTGGR